MSMDATADAHADALMRQCANRGSGIATIYVVEYD